MQPSKFTIRIYGILINENNEVLLANENIGGRLVNKFPGGGMELGEGPKECVVREFMEETGQHIEVLEHFYTTDFYIHSQINPACQVVGIYYKVDCATASQIEVIKEKDKITLKWVTLAELSENDVTFEADKAEVRLLIK